MKNSDIKKLLKARIESCKEEAEILKHKEDELGHKTDKSIKWDSDYFGICMKKSYNQGRQDLAQLILMLFETTN